MEFYQRTAPVDSKIHKTFLSFHLPSFYDLIQNQFQHVKIAQNSQLKIIHDRKRGYMAQFYFDEPSFFFPSFEFFDLVQFLSTLIISILKRSNALTVW